jgi:murein DD-endopeptidase MepM/ murein hydrolase activator NlpD
VDALGVKICVSRSAFGLVAGLLLALSACSSAQKMAIEASYTGVAYDTVKDPNTPGVYRARAAFDDKHEAQSEHIKAQTLLNGVEYLQKQGYDYVAWNGPYPATLTSTRTSYGVTISTRVYRGFDYIVQGWKSAEGNVRQGARPISAALVELKSQVEQAGSVSAVASNGAASPSSRLNWPLQGKVVKKFGEPVQGKPITGIMIEAEDGAVVKAADAGSVDLAGPSALSLVHPGGYTALYVCINSVLVKQGDTVTAGQPLAKIGKSTCRDMPDNTLVFFVRRNRQQVDPLTVLPAQ